MASFDVETYQISVAASSADSAQPRMLYVSPAMTHGIRNRAWVYFRPNQSGLADESSIGYAFNVGGLNFDGITLSVNISSSMFDDVYTITRTESPLRVIWYYKDLPGAPDSTTKLVTSFRVGTLDEIPGEGNADAAATVADALLEQALADISL